MRSVVWGLLDPGCSVRVVVVTALAIDEGDSLGTTDNSAVRSALVQVFLAPASLDDALAAQGRLARSVLRWGRTAASSASSGTSGGIEISIGRRIADPIDHVLRDRRYLLDDTVGAYIEIACADAEPDRGIRLVAGLATALDGLVDVSRSRVAVGGVHIVRPGDGPTVLFHWLRKRADISRESFHEYWAGGHTRHSSELTASFGYRQLHVDAEWTKRAADASRLPAADFEGVAMTRSADPDAYVRHMTSTAASKGMGDNATFVDVDRSPYITLWNVAAVTA